MKKQSGTQSFWRLCDLYALAILACAVFIWSLPDSKPIVRDVAFSDSPSAAASSAPGSLSPDNPTAAPITSPFLSPPSKTAASLSKPVPTYTHMQATPRPQYRYEALAMPTDPGVSSQWYIPRLNFDKAWDYGSGAGAIVAVIDTGFSLNHEDLSDQWALNTAEIGPTTNQGPAPNCTSRGKVLDKSCNNLDDDSDGFKDNYRGWDFIQNDNDPSAGTTANTTAASHGTSVAAIAAMKASNGKGYAGLAYGAKILPIQVLNDTGNGYTDQVADGVLYAVEHGAKVINLSLGGDNSDPYLQSVIQYAVSQGVLVVAAAGNGGCNCLSYPGSYEEVIGVGATDANDKRASFSNYNSTVDVVAPGAGGICTAVWTQANPTSLYSCQGQGTSFATPVVSAALAIARANNPGTDPRHLVEAVKRGIIRPAGMANATYSAEYGYGRLNALAVLHQSATPIGPGQKSGGTISAANPRDLVSVCTSYPFSSCGLQAVNTATAQVIDVDYGAVDEYGSRIIFWNPLAKGLSVGEWSIQSYIRRYDNQPQVGFSTSLIIQ